MKKETERGKGKGKGDRKGFHHCFKIMALEDVCVCVCVMIHLIEVSDDLIEQSQTLQSLFVNVTLGVKLLEVRD